MKYLKILLIILSILLLIIVGMMIFGNKQKNENNLIVEDNEILSNDKNNEIKLVDSPIMYFTVQSCVGKYINCLNEKNLEKIYNLLDYEYVKEHSITKNNVLDYVEEVYETSEFQTQKMYVEEIDEKNEKYYVKGILGKATFMGDDIAYEEQKEFVVTININHENMTFSVIPFGYGGVFYEQ